MSSKQNLMDIFQIWVDRIAEEFPNSKYIDYSVEDFYEQFKNSRDRHQLYPDNFWYLDHFSFTPSQKRLRELAKDKWNHLLMVSAVAL